MRKYVSTYIYIYILRFLIYIFINRIRIDIEGAAGTLYDGEKFQLLFKFSDQYPFDSPQVR